VVGSVLYDGAVRRPPLLSCAAVLLPLSSSLIIQHSILLMSERGSFGTKIGVILATAGSAVGLGNIWRFPYLTGQDGGAAFLLVYLVSILILGIPGMIAEFIVGRHGASNAARAYYQLGGRWWSLIGYMGAVTSMIILGFYAVVAGWCLQYLVVSVLGGLNGNPA